MAALQTYTRDDLRDYAARVSIQGYTNQVLRSAQEGKTWHLIELNQVGQTINLDTMTVNKILTKDEIIPVLQRIFPDCRIVYIEDWIETRPDTRVFKKGILVDWS